MCRLTRYILTGHTHRAYLLGILQPTGQVGSIALIAKMAEKLLEKDASDLKERFEAV